MLMQLGLGFAAGSFDSISTWLRNRGWRGTEEMHPPYRTILAANQAMRLILAQSTDNNDAIGVVIWADEVTLLELEESGITGALGANLLNVDPVDRTGKDWLVDVWDNYDILEGSTINKTDAGIDLALANGETLQFRSTPVNQVLDGTPPPPPPTPAQAAPPADDSQANEQTG